MNLDAINEAAATYRNDRAFEEAKEKYYAEKAAEEAAAAEAEANKPITEKITDFFGSINYGENIRSAMGETYSNGTSYMPAYTQEMPKIEEMGDLLSSAADNLAEIRKKGAQLQAAGWESMKTGDNTALSAAVENIQAEGGEFINNLGRAVTLPGQYATKDLVSHYADDKSSPVLRPLAQYLQQTDTNLQYYMTDADQMKLARDIQTELGIPAEAIIGDKDAYKKALEVYHFKKKVENIEDVWDMYPELKDVANMDTQSAAIALHEMNAVKQTHGIIDSFLHGFGKGSDKLEYDEIQYKIMRGEATDEEKKRAEDLKARMEKERTQYASFLDAMAGGAAESLPEMVESIKTGGASTAAMVALSVAFTVATGGTGAAAIAGGVALRTAILRALGSTAAKRAFQAGMFWGMAKPEMGARFGELGELKNVDGTPLLSEDERRLYAAVGGATNAGIEMANLGLITNALKPYPHATKVFGDIVKNAAIRKSQQEKLMQYAGGWAKNTLTIAASESGEEALQSAADDAIHNYIVADKGAYHIKSYSLGEIAGRSYQSAVEAFPAALGFGVTGATIGAAGRAGTAYRSARRDADIARVYGENARQTMAGTVMVEQLQQAVSSGKLKEKAPDVQKKILRSQLSGTGYEMAYIDVETALKNEKGMDDLQKIAKETGMTDNELQTAIEENGIITVPTEILSQVSTTPDLLDSVSFKPEAESMARMRETQKELVKQYDKAIEEMAKRREKILETIVKENLPNATDEQKRIIREAITSNPDNPAQGWNTLRKGVQEKLDEILAPALKALKAGMGQGRLLEIDDEQGNKKTIPTPGENAPWYSNFLNIYKHRPNKIELEDMAIAMITGDPSAPKVENWIPDSAEMELAMQENKGTIEAIKADLAAIDSVKASMKDMTGTEMNLTSVFEPETYKAYKKIMAFNKSVGGSTARQARAGAILSATHAQIIAKRIEKLTGKKYTAEDYVNDKLEFTIRPLQKGMNQFAGETAENASIDKLVQAKNLEKQGTSMEDIYKETGWVKGYDGKWRFEIPDNLDAVNWDVFKKGNTENKSRLLKYVYKNPKLYEAYPWLENINVEVRQMEGNTYGGVVKNYNGSYIVIKEDVGDEQKSGTLIHEIQHLIQDEEGFAVGGTDENANEQIIDRIRELNKRIQSYDYGAEYADAIMDQQETFLESLENPEAAEILNNEISELEKKIPAKERDEIWQLASDRQYLREALNENTGNDYSLYRNLAGEQEARHATDRAIIHTNVVRAEKELAEKKAKYEVEKAKQSPAMKKMLDELEALREKDEKTDAEFDRIDEIQAAMDDKLMQAETFYSWAKDTLEMRREEAAETPQPHDENAIVVFGGQEMALSQEPNPDDILYQRAWHGTPHNFNVFDLGAIGTGEGTQAHGWGLYFAKDRKVSDEYKKKLSGWTAKIKRKNILGLTKEVKIKQDEYTYQNRDKLLKRDEDIALQSLIFTDYEKNKAIKLLKKNYPERQKAIKLLENDDIKIEWDMSGNLFEVEIPDDDVLLDEQKPFEEQSEKVKAALTKLYEDLIPSKIGTLDKFTNGKEVYRHLLRAFQDSRTASETLNEYGIKGITYEGSQDGRCFVIFDDKAISIIEKYNQDAPLFQRAWHGSPYDFETFDLGAIGTGEGAAVHGWGLYFAGNREVSEEYKSRLARQTNADNATGKIGNEHYYRKGGIWKDSKNNNASPAVTYILNSIENEYGLPNDAKRTNKKEWSNSIRFNAEGLEKYESSKERAKELKEAADIFDANYGNINFNIGGKLFEVEIPDNDVLLDEQKPFSQQPEKVQEALKKLVSESNTATKHPNFAKQIFESTGKKIYGIVSGLAEGDAPKNANFDNIQRLGSELLNKYGIKGIAYEGGQDGRCYVIFDDKAISIIEKYNQNAPLFQRAWHGTPHNFNVFDLGAIGTGEGAQAHGWGLYFAANREISDAYKNKLSRGVLVDGDAYRTIASLEPFMVQDGEGKIFADRGIYTAVKALELTQNVDDAIALLKKRSQSKAKGIARNAQEGLDFLQDKKIEYNKGKLFEVEIPDNDVLLDEQKSFTQQSKTVQESIKKVFTDLSIENKLLLSTNEPVIKDYVDLKYRLKQAVDSLDKAIKLPKFKSMILSDMVDNRLIDYLTAEKIRQDESLLIQKREEKASQLEKVTKELQEKLANTDLASEYKNKTGKEIYKRISQLLGNDKKASEEFNKNGVKGITYDGLADGRCYVIFDDKAISIIEKHNQAAMQQYVQGQTANVNGKRIVSIMEHAADESTFMHEMAHVFLYDLQELAAIDEDSRLELEVVSEWAEWHKGDAQKLYSNTPWTREFAQREQEIIDAEEHHDYDLAEQKKREWVQERFARAFELYLRDGQAPSSRLKAVFRQFKEFLARLYRAFINDGARASEPVKRVMDRMIATEDEIQAAELEDRYSDFEAAGGEKLFDETDAEVYKRWYKECEEDAKEKLLKIVMKDLEQARQEEFDTKVAIEEQRKRAELRQENVYVAEQAVLASGDENIVKEWYPSVEAFQEELAITPPLEDVLREHMQKYRDNLDAELMNSHLSPETVDKVMDTAKYRNKLEALKSKAMAKKAGLINRINAKAARAMDSLEDKLNALPDDMDLKMNAHEPQIKSIMKEVNKLRFASKWTKDELGHIESMIRAGTQAEIKQALKDFKEKARQDKAQENAVMKANEGRRHLFRELAKQAATNKPIADSCNVNYYKSEARKAARRVQDMLRAGRWDMALVAQEQLGFQTAMVEIAEKNKEKMEKLVAQVKRELNAKTVRLPKDERYWHRHLAFLLRITQTDAAKPESGVKELDDLFGEMKEALDIQDVPLKILDVATRGEDFQGYPSLTLDEFKEAVDAIHILYKVGKDKFKLKTIAGKTIGEVVDEIRRELSMASASMVDAKKINDDKGGLAYSETIGNTGSIGHLLAKQGQQYILSNLKPENLINMLGEKAHKYLYGTLERAAEEEAKLQEQNIKALREIMSVYSHQERQDFTKKMYEFSTEGTDKISKENIMAMALNWGTLSNRQRLLGGLAKNNTPEAVNQMMNEVMDLFEETMTEKDWLTVQRLWDHVNSYWDMTVKVEEELNGTALVKIPPMAFTMRTADGKTVELAGGYMEVKYNPEKSSKAAEQDINKAAQTGLAGNQRLGAGRAFTKGRSEFDIFRALKLNFDVIENHLQDVIHNATYRIPVRDVYRILTNLDFENYVVDHLGRDAHNILKDWALDAWKQNINGSNTADNVISRSIAWLRSNSTMAIMGMRLWPAIENVSNLSIAVDKIGAGKMAAALGQFYASPAECMAKVKNMSIFMRNRLENMDRDIRSQTGIFRARNKLAEFASQHAYDLMVYSDLMVSAPLWLKSYKDAYAPSLEKVKRENEANIAYVMQAQQELDAVIAQINDIKNETAQMEEHLRARRYASPETAELLRQSPFAVHTDDNLRALSGENKKRLKELEKELWKAEVKFQEAQEIKILSDDEIIAETERQAVFAADGVIRDTFGSGRMLDQASVQRSKNELTKLLTTFYSFFNTQFNALFMAYQKGQTLPNANVIQRWMPFAKSFTYRVVGAALIGSTLQFAMGLAGNDDDDKKRKEKNAEGKEIEVEIPAYERFLKVFAKNTLSISSGSMYFVRDIIGLATDFVLSGKSYGLNTGSVATRSLSEFGKMFALMAKKGEKDAQIQEQQEKREAAHQEKLQKLKGKKRQEYLKKWEEEQQYIKPPKRITYTEIAGHGLKGMSGLTANYTGVTSTMVNAVTSTMQYLLDTDMRYDPTMKNIIWSAIFDKKPVEREIPQKPAAEPKVKKKTNNKK